MELWRYTQPDSLVWMGMLLGVHIILLRCICSYQKEFIKVTDYQLVDHSSSNNIIQIYFDFPSVLNVFFHTTVQKEGQVIYQEIRLVQYPSGGF